MADLGNARHKGEPPVPIPELPTKGDSQTGLGTIGAGNTPKPPRIFYGWYNVIGVMVVFTFAAGFIFYNLTVLLQILVKTRGFTVGAVSGATSVCFLCTGFAGLAIAQLIDRFDVRWFIAGSGLLGGIVLALVGQITTIWQLYLAYSLLGVSYAGCTMVPGTTLVARWFVRNRSVAIATASTGFSIGGIVVTPWTVLLIKYQGLEVAAPIMGLCLILFTVPVSLLLMRPWPEKMGLRPDGDGPVTPQAEDAPERSDPVFGQAVTFDFWEALRSRYFVFTTTATLMVMMAQIGVLTHLFNHVDIRTSSATATLAVSSMAACSLVGRLAGGFLLRRVSHRVFGLSIYAYHLVSVAMLGLADGPWALPIAAGAFGAVVGNIVLLPPLLIGEAFGQAIYARLFAVNMLVMNIGMAIGPTLVGWAFERFNDYTPAYLVASLGGGIAFVMLLAAGRAPER
tara:strand:+ start:1352 stop:2713 length:1362 start_codon:yes stop_codon:yes gene_type:complete